MKIFQDEGVYISRNKTKRYCKGICELHLPWGIYHKVQFIFYYIILTALNRKSEHIGIVTGNYHLRLLMHVGEGVLGKVSASVCTQACRAREIPSFHFIWKPRGTKQLNQLLIFFTGKGWREQGWEKEKEGGMNGGWETGREGGKKVGKQAGEYAGRRDKQRKQT